MARPSLWFTKRIPSASNCTGQLAFEKNSNCKRGSQAGAVEEEEEGRRDRRRRKKRTEEICEEHVKISRASITDNRNCHGTKEEQLDTLI